MSQQIQTVRCQCGHEFETSLTDAINVAQQPEDRARLFAGEINVVDCSACGTKFHVARPILYFDARQKILVWCYPEVEPERQKGILEEHRALISQQFALLPPQLRPRKVRYIFGGLDDLVEVVTLLEGGQEPVAEPASKG